MKYKKLNNGLRRRSGTVTSSDPLVGLFYDLIIRGHVAPGDLEALTRMNTTPVQKMIFTNGYVASYAKDLAKRLRVKS